MTIGVGRRRVRLVSERYTTRKDWMMEKTIKVDRCATDMIRSIHKIGASVAVHNDEGILTIATMED